MSRERKKFGLANPIFLLLLVLAYQPATLVAFAEPTNPVLLRTNQIIWETFALPEYMDPHKNYESAGGWIHANIYETLFTYDFDSADTRPIIPLLAESVHISSDGLNYTFTLRQGITFHDGTSFNATCVQMNFWRMLGRGWDSGFGPVWMIAEPILGGQTIEDVVYAYGDGSPQHIGNWTEWIETSNAIIVLDEFTVRIRLAHAYSPFLTVVAYSVASIVSPTFFMAHGGMSPESDDLTLNEEACGTGPYILEEWIQDENLTIALNGNYWRKNNAKIMHPQVGSMSEVTFKLNMDINSRMLNLQAGASDGCDWSLFNAYDIWNNVTTRGDGTLQSLDPKIKVWTGLPNYNIEFLGFNMRQHLNDSGNIVENPFRIYELRKAVSYAFDSQALIDSTQNGVAIHLAGPIPRGMFAHDDDIITPELNLSEAVLQWNQAMVLGLDDVWANNSYEFNIYYVEGGFIRWNTCLLLKQAIEIIIADPASLDPSLPLTINLIGIDWAKYLYLIKPGRPSIPIFFLGWAPNYADPDDYITPFVKSTSTFPKRVGLEGSHGRGAYIWDHITIDAWIDAAANELDSSARISLYTQIQEAIIDHCAYLWLYQGVEFHVERVEINGYVYNPMREPYFYHYYKSTGRLAPNILIQVLLASVYIGICIVAIGIIRKH
ncbi:MAG: ABC transporter substrate-binding protein [Candidatus Thorarchaeota archaeon]